MNDNDLYFPHEKLDCYRLAAEVARWVADAMFRRGDADLRDQAVRSARSVVLNIVEGSGKTGRAQSVGNILDLVQISGVYP